VNVTLDGKLNSTMTTTLSGDQSPLSSISPFALYDVQLLPYGNHDVTVLLLDWTAGGDTILYFDHAVVNDTTPSPNPSASDTRHSQ
jgi:hypothetical protein